MSNGSHPERCSICHRCFNCWQEREFRIYRLLWNELRVFFTFMLPCIAIDFFLNNQPDALIIPVLFCYKTLRVSGIFSAHHQEFSTVHSALVSFMQFSDDRFQAESGWNILTLLGTECAVENSLWWAEKLPETCKSFVTEWNWDNWCVCLVKKKRSGFIMSVSPLLCLCAWNISARTVRIVKRFHDQPRGLVVRASDY